jgi:hypothetical protein
MLISQSVRVLDTTLTVNIRTILRTDRNILKIDPDIQDYLWPVQKGSFIDNSRRAISRMDV